MNWICKIFGHKYVSILITKGPFWDDTYWSRNLDEPICKRCGKRMYEK